METEAKIKREIRLMKQVQRMYLGIPYHTINRTHGRKTNEVTSSTEIDASKNSLKLSTRAKASTQSRTKPKSEHKVCDKFVGELKSACDVDAKTGRNNWKQRCSPPNRDLTPREQTTKHEHLDGRVSRPKAKTDKFAKCDNSKKRNEPLGKSKTAIEEKSTRRGETDIENTARTHSVQSNKKGSEISNRMAVIRPSVAKTRRRKETNDTIAANQTCQSSRVQKATDVRAYLNSKAKPKYNFSHITCGLDVDEKSEERISTSLTAPSNVTGDNNLALHRGRALPAWSSPSTHVLECFGDHSQTIISSEHLNVDAIRSIDDVEGTATVKYDDPVTIVDAAVNMADIYINTSTGQSIERKLSSTKLTEVHNECNDGIDTPANNSENSETLECDYAYCLNHRRSKRAKLIRSRSPSPTWVIEESSEASDTGDLSPNHQECILASTLMQTRRYDLSDEQYQKQKRRQEYAQQSISWVKRKTKLNTSTQWQDRGNARDSPTIATWQMNKPARLLPLRPQLLSTEILFKSTGTSTCEHLTVNRSTGQLDRTKRTTVGTIMLVSIGYIVTIPPIHQFIGCVGHVNRTLRKWIRRQEIRLLTVVESRLMQLCIDENYDN